MINSEADRAGGGGHAPRKTSPPPILVTGSHRSGTTWVGRTIASHPSVRYIAEPFNVINPNYMMNLALDTWFTHCESSPARGGIEAAFDRILRPRSPVAYAADVCRAFGPDLKLPLRFAKHAMLAWSRPVALVKDPLALLSAEWMHERYGARIVCMIRSPLAFVGSVKVTGWDVDFDHFRRQRGLMEGLLAPHADEVTRLCDPAQGDFIDRVSLLWNMLHHAIAQFRAAHPGWLFVRYEDLAREPLPGFATMLGRLDLDMSESVRRHIEAYTARGNAVESKTDAYQPRDASQSLKTWKTRLTEDETERVKACTMTLAREFYAPEELL